MFALVKLYHVCPLDCVSKTHNGGFCIKLNDGSQFDADLITRHSSYELMESLQHSLCCKVPKVVLNRCDIKDANQLKTKIKEEPSINELEMACGMNVQNLNSLPKLEEIKRNNLSYPGYTLPQEDNTTYSSGKENLYEAKTVSNEFIPRPRWSPSTKTEFFKHFQKHLDKGTLPSNKECLEAQLKFPNLQSKSIAAVKTAIMNEMNRRKRVRNGNF